MDYNEKKEDKTAYERESGRKGRNHGVDVQTK